MRFLADENFNNHICRALFLQRPGIDLVRAQDVGLYGLADEAVLAFALRENRILLTHDVRTIPALALRILQNGQPIPGILLVNQSAATSRVIADLLLKSNAVRPRNGLGKFIICRFERG